MIFTDQIRLAIDTATRLHAGQVRKDGKTPAISHPYGVAMILTQYPDVSEETIIAGLLHDVLEDVPESDYSAEDMDRDFGPDVLEIVRGVTEDKTIGSWKERKARYMEVLAASRDESLMVSAADMTHNLRSFIEGIQHDPIHFNAKFKGTAREMIEFYGERAGLIYSRIKHPLSEAALEAFGLFQACVEGS